MRNIIVVSIVAVLVASSPIAEAGKPSKGSANRAIVTIWDSACNAGNGLSNDTIDQAATYVDYQLSSGDSCVDAVVSGANGYSPMNLNRNVDGELCGIAQGAIPSRTYTLRFPDVAIPGLAPSLCAEAGGSPDMIDPTICAVTLPNDSGDFVRLQMSLFDSSLETGFVFTIPNDLGLALTLETTGTALISAEGQKRRVTYDGEATLWKDKSNKRLKQTLGDPFCFSISIEMERVP